MRFIVSSGMSVQRLNNRFDVSLLVVARGPPPAVAINLAFLSALLFVAPFGLLAFLCALLVRLFEKGKDRDQERSE